MKTGSIIIDKNLSKNVLIFHFINYFSQVYLTFSALQTQTLFYFFFILFYFILFIYLFFANSVDPDETAHNEPSHQDLHCLPFLF